MLVIDFEVGNADGVRDVRRDAGLDALEEVFACSRDQTRLLVCAHHCVRFPGACLSVGEDTGVIAFEVVVKKFLPKCIVNVLLVSVVFV